MELLLYNLEPSGKSDTLGKYSINTLVHSAYKEVDGRGVLLIRDTPNNILNLKKRLDGEDVKTFVIEDGVQELEELKEIKCGFQSERDLLLLINNGVLYIYEVGVFESVLIFQKENIDRAEWSKCGQYLFTIEYNTLNILSGDFELFNQFTLKGNPVKLDLCDNQLIIKYYNYLQIYDLYTSESLYCGSNIEYTLYDNTLIVDNTVLSTGKRFIDKSRVENFSGSPSSFIYKCGDTFFFENRSRGISLSKTHTNIHKYKYIWKGDTLHLILTKKMKERYLYFLETYSSRITSLESEKEFTLHFYGPFVLLLSEDKVEYYEKKYLYTKILTLEVESPLVALSKVLALYNKESEILTLYKRSVPIRNIQLGGLSKMEWAPNGLFIYLIGRDGLVIYDVNGNLICKKHFSQLSLTQWRPHPTSKEVITEEDIDELLGTSRDENIIRKGATEVKVEKEKWITFLLKQKYLLSQ